MLSQHSHASSGSNANPDDFGCRKSSSATSLTSKLKTYLPASSSSTGSIQAAIARTASRSLALYFARPMRLFRPSKVNGWQTLKSLARHQGTTLSHQYILSLIRLQGVWVIPKHFIPPMLVNATLGSVLWGSYSMTYDLLEPYLQGTLINAAVSGSIAGASQAIVAAPAENVRILLEHGFGAHSWSCAWKEVFQVRKQVASADAFPSTIHDVRRLRSWFHDVRHMAGQGWNGWGWGCSKDAVGFAAFFVIFELSRRTGAHVKVTSENFIASSSSTSNPTARWRQMPPILNGMTLVAGGVMAGLSYEYVCRPWDVARRIIHIERTKAALRTESTIVLLQRQYLLEGISTFFKLHDQHNSTEPPTRVARFLRTAGRVGPWGVGFLVWEAYGSGLT